MMRLGSYFTENDMTKNMLPVCRAKELETRLPEQKWLIHSLWSYSAVGILGGAPKCCKSWLALDMAISVASQTSCLDRFPVHAQGPALIFMAEDALAALRGRIDSLCEHRGLDLNLLDLYVITAPTLRLDLADDQQRLESTIKEIKPRLVILDPLVRMHALDENSSADMSRLLGYIRRLQRTCNTSILIVHHAGKKHRARPGQALRGSSDLHAFGDSNAYLTRTKERITLTIEHRAARQPEPIELELLSRDDDSHTHLEIVSSGKTADPTPLTERIMTLIEYADKPLTRTSLREQLKVNNQHLGQTLTELDKRGLLLKTTKGWQMRESTAASKTNLSPQSRNHTPVQCALF